MPVEKTECGGCGKQENTCPDCGSNMVTPLDNPQKRKPTTVAMYGGPEEETYTNVCWDCGWTEEVTVTFERKIQE